MFINDYQENYITGWVKIFRSVRNHWIWTDPVKFKWWIDILLEVNHCSNKVNIGYDIYECNRGESYNSLRTWALRWNTSAKTVKKFFSLLQKDKMILTEVVGKGKHSTTKLTVCKYDTYQSENSKEETLSKRNGNATETQEKHNVPTNKNEKNYKNEKNDNNIKYYDEFVRFVDFCNSHIKTNGKVRNFKAIKNGIFKSFVARRKDGYDSVQFANAVRNAMKVQSHIDNGFTYLTPEFFTRSSTLEKYATL